MKASHFTVTGNFDGAHVATVTIERGPMLISVRPYRRRRAYTLPLSAVAYAVICQVVRAELREKRAAKRRGRAS